MTTAAILGTDIAGDAPFLPAEVAAPASVADLQSLVRAATAAGHAVIPRGAGMSYTGGYAATEPGAVLLDLRRLDRIVSIDVANRCAVVEAGVTWAALHAALAPHGLRLGSFGPLSGHASTIGGGLSQHAMFFGAGTHGMVGDVVLGLRVVLADGSLLNTGALARCGGPPFFRAVAPDLTGLFLGDAGGFGVKAEVALRVIAAPTHERYASFAFPDMAALARAQARAAGLGVAAECYGFDATANRHLAERGFGLRGTAALAGEVARASRNPMDAARALFSAAGSRVRPDAHAATLHVVTEGDTPGEADERMARLRASIGGAGREVADTIPRVTRAKPFRRVRALLGPRGQNWLPVHGIVPASAAPEAIAAVEAFLASRAPLFAAHRIEVATLTTAGPGWLLVEPQFFWFDALSAFLRAAVLPEQLAAYGDRPADPEARAAVHAARAELRDVLDAAGAVHIQPGKYYPLRIDPVARAMLAAMKAMLDPHGRMNPGALGLP